ncbi:hypothetical protein NW762_011724 [Fusarium torreyae]|uniref:Uncharacterized protein n=1 Tax=Fusarium torreyae TaxID=1237075 RepID=A0A9W8RQY1_9HYPO|nr:hypothetical protein NW762_011724 [Fusarium torreyae]
MYKPSVFILLTLGKYASASSSPNETELVEQLFLDYTVHDVVNNAIGMPVIEPWASEYVSALQEKRYGDAVWARYHILGEVRNGVVETTNQTVLESITEDAMGYKANAPEQYAEAVSFYAKSSGKDTHNDVLNVISRVNHQQVSALQERVTYSIGCSGDHLAYQSSCLRVLDDMPTPKTQIGNIRRVAVYNSCHLRVGPYTSAPDLTYYTAHAVARLIEEQCSRVPACCNSVKVSGSSPRNSGHPRLSLKRSQRQFANAQAANRDERDISSVFHSFSGGPDKTLPQTSADVKRSLINRSAGRHVLQASWKRLLKQLRSEAEIIKAQGTVIIAEIDLYDIGRPSAELDQAFRKRGVAVIRQVVPEKEARNYKTEVEKYITANPST